MGKNALKLERQRRRGKAAREAAAADKARRERDRQARQARTEAANVLSNRERRHRDLIRRPPKPEPAADKAPRPVRVYGQDDLYSLEELRFLQAVDRVATKDGRPLRVTEYLAILRQLGYRPIAGALEADYVI